MPVVIRKLAPEEITALAPDTFTLAPIFNRLSTYAGLQGSILVAEVDGTLAGCAALAYGGEARDGGALHVEHFAILPAFRGHGVGFKLMKAVLDEARHFNALSVRAEIPAWCPDWRAFYSRFGFVLTDPESASAMTGTTPIELQLNA